MSESGRGDEDELLNALVQRDPRERTQRTRSQLLGGFFEFGALYDEVEGRSFTHTQVLSTPGLLIELMKSRSDVAEVRDAASQDADAAQRWDTASRELEKVTKRLGNDPISFTWETQATRARLR